MNTPLDIFRTLVNTQLDIFRTLVGTKSFIFCVKIDSISGSSSILGGQVSLVVRQCRGVGSDSAGSITPAVGTFILLNDQSTSAPPFSIFSTDLDHMPIRSAPTPS